MYVGLDYGTSNCAIAHRAVVSDSSGAAEPNGAADPSQLIPLENGRAFIPSVLQAADRSLVAQAANMLIADEARRQAHGQRRAQQLRLANRKQGELGLADNAPHWSMGQHALNTYFADPELCWFVKSPKSFLGAIGLRDLQIALFEDLVALMMHYIKGKAEAHLAKGINQVVIGRPINFQGIGGEESNRQAVEILSAAAHNCGFKSVEFFYEPLAAGLEYEAQLTEDKIVLVLDIGGGTTDCSMVRMGPSHRQLDDRSACFLGHAGTRIGGNDLDIALAFEQLMLPLGNKGHLKSGLPIPAQFYFNAVSINDLRAQDTFFSQDNADDLARLVQDAQHPEQVRYLQTLQEKRLNYRLVQQAEASKIALTDAKQHDALLDFIAPGLVHGVTDTALAEAIDRPVQKIVALLSEVAQQAQLQPDVVFVTGGTGQSPSVQQAVRNVLGDTPLVQGDAFGSVVSGLARWAERIYR